MPLEKVPLHGCSKKTCPCLFWKATEKIEAIRYLEYWKKNKIVGNQCERE